LEINIIITSEGYRCLLTIRQHIIFAPEVKFIITGEKRLGVVNKTTDAILEFNSNVAKAWTSFFSVPQQQFFRPYTDFLV
jgi:hypothetical protein